MPIVVCACVCVCVCVCDLCSMLPSTFYNCHMLWRSIYEWRQLRLILGATSSSTYVCICNIATLPSRCCHNVNLLQFRFPVCAKFDVCRVTLPRLVAAIVIALKENFHMIIFIRWNMPTTHWLTVSMYVCPSICLSVCLSSYARAPRNTLFVVAVVIVVVVVYLTLRRRRGCSANSVWVVAFDFNSNLDSNIDFDFSFSAVLPQQLFSRRIWPFQSRKNRSARILLRFQLAIFQFI